LIEQRMKLFLIGYRCTGKTTIGKRLADHLGYAFLDTDQIIEQQAGSSISDMVELHGWDHFRQVEQNALFNTEILQDTVIATGGGIIINPENRRFIQKNGFCIWFDADIQTILSRLSRDNKTASSRPSLTSKDLLEETEELLSVRIPLYEECSHMKVDTRFDSPEKLVKIIDRRLC